MRCFITIDLVVKRDSSSASCSIQDISFQGETYFYKIKKGFISEALRAEEPGFLTESCGEPGLELCNLYDFIYF